MLHLEGEARDWSTYNEYSFRIILMMLIPISQLNFEGVECRILFTSCANTPKTWWERQFTFFAEGASKFLETYFRKTLIAKNNNDNNNVQDKRPKLALHSEPAFYSNFWYCSAAFTMVSSLFRALYIPTCIYI